MNNGVKRLALLILSLSIVFTMILFVSQTAEGNVETTVDEIVSEQSAAETEAQSQSRLQTAGPVMVTETIDKMDAEEETIRYTVLVLDTSGSMRNTPIEEQKEAATKFCESVINAEGINKIAIVALNSSASVGCEFTDDIELLTEYIAGTKAEGGTNTNGALEAAADLLNKISDNENTIKNVVICSDGLPEHGTSQEGGIYTSEDHSCYATANSAYDTATELKQSGSYIYSLGFFHSLSGNNLNFCRRFMMDISSGSDYYYEIIDAADLEFTFGEIADDVVSDAVKGTFYYASGNEQDYSSTFYYDDNYFTTSSYEYQDSLATMSMCLALSAFGSNETNDYTKKSINLKNLLADCGFDDNNFATNQGFQQQPGTDTIGVGASYKTIKDDDELYTLIAVAVRGGGYAAEWAGNFAIGETGQHQGFSEARDQVLDFLKNYVEEHPDITGKVKLWVAGYSRAAATTNLVAGKLDDGFILSDKIELNLDDIYAYCFESPRGALKSDDVTNEKYNNIFSIINPGDVVTKVAPSEPEDAFGFQRYGVPQFLPTALDCDGYGGSYEDIKKKMLDKYFLLDSTDKYVVDDFQMKKISIANLIFDPAGNFSEGIIVEDTDSNWDQNAFLDELLRMISGENLKSRSNYVAVYQEDIREILKIFMGTDQSQWDKFENELYSNMNEDIVSVTAAIISSSELLLNDIIEDNIFDALETAGITDYNSLDIALAAGKIANLLIDFGLSHPNMLITAICNVKSIGAAHFPELCLSWLQSFDFNYTKDGNRAFTSGAYRVIHINCPVDLQVFDSMGNLIAEITDDIISDIEGSSIVSYINENGEKLVYLPASESYSLNLTATDDGRMTYAINEYSERFGGINRVVYFNNINLTKDETFSSEIPAASDSELEEGVVDGSTAEYKLRDSDNNEIQPDANIKGEEAVKANCTVVVTANNDEHGIVTGSDYVVYGNYAKLTAKAVEGCRFVGWYVDNELFSSEAEYRFCVTEDIEVVGMFAPNHIHNYSTEFKWAEDNETCTAIFNCTECDDEQALDCTITKKTKGYKTRYTATVEFDGETYSDSKTVASGLPEIDEKRNNPLHCFFNWLMHLFRW